MSNYYINDKHYKSPDLGQQHMLTNTLLSVYGFQYLCLTFREASFKLPVSVCSWLVFSGMVMASLGAVVSLLSSKH